MIVEETALLWSSRGVKKEVMEQPSQTLLSEYFNTASMKANQKAGRSALGILSKCYSHHGSSDACPFSSSLPDLSHERYFGIRACSIYDTTSKSNELDKDIAIKDSFGDLDLQGVGKLLPDEGELFDGIMNDFNQAQYSNQVEQLEDCDLFSSGGGIELDVDPIENVTVGLSRAYIGDGTYIGDGYKENANLHHSFPNGVSTIVGEHPYGEHPSRTLFVRSIDSNVDDSELRSLFEQYGDIRSMYTHCKNRGFVMISYYDIRHARNAMYALQNKRVRKRKLDIHFSIPKDNPSEKDMNQGTLVVFNLDPSISIDKLHQIFGVFGEVKEIRETPNKRHHKFIEYYDVRAAENALRSLNNCDIAGSIIKLEPSRPGGVRRNLKQQHLSLELEHDALRNYRHQVSSPLINSPPGNWSQFSSSVDDCSLRNYGHSSTLGSGSPINSKHLFPPRLSNSLKVGPIGKEQNRTTRSSLMFSKPENAIQLLSHSFPENGSALMPNLSSSPCTMGSFDSSASSASEIGTLTGSQFLWGSPNCIEDTVPSTWMMSSLGQSAKSNGKGYGCRSSSLLGSAISSSYHQIGSAPSEIPFEGNFVRSNEPSDRSLGSPHSFGNMDVYQNEGSTINTFLPRGPANPLKSYSGLISGNSSLRLRTMPPQRMGNMFLGSFPYARQGSSGIEGFSEPVRIHRTDHCGSQLESQQQFQLDLDKIISGDDTRTTLMIKNIPNKYTSEMLLVAIDENHRGAYDFFYLPIDFKNKCNVGYAFINLLSPFHIISFYQAFNGKKWEKFNSEKVASLAYARIQGKAALDVRFQNSSLMNEDRRCRPILFNSMRLEDSDQEPLDDGMNGIYSRRQQTLEPNIPLVGKNVYENADRLVPRNRCGESVEEHEGAEASMCKKL